jgi:hypothetical protein
MVQGSLFEAVRCIEVTFWPDLFGSGKEPLVGWCEYGNEPSAKAVNFLRSDAVHVSVTFVELIC